MLLGPCSQGLTSILPRIPDGFVLGPIQIPPSATSRDEVKLYVGYLRRKLAPDSPGSTPIETVRGFGYRYKIPN